MTALVSLTVCLVVLATATPAFAQFAQRSGAGFTLNGRPWRFLGYNAYRMSSDRPATACGTFLDDATVDALLEDARKAGSTVVRTWFFQRYYRDAGNSYAPFDRVLAKARAKGLKVIPVLVNHSPDCEPSGGQAKTEAFYAQGFREAGWGYTQAYKDWAFQVASHYRDEATIAFWQLVNEAETSSSGACDRTIEANGRSHSSNVLRSFADEMVAHVKAADPNHLVSLGTIGSGQCGAEGAEYAHVHAGSVDLCEYHDYGDVLQAVPDDGFNRLRQRIEQCAALNKPLVIGEAGIPADVGPDGQPVGVIDAVTLQRRADLFEAKIRAAFTMGIDGYLIWQKISDASNSPANLGEGRFGVGPSSLFFDPLNGLTCALAREFAIAPLVIVTLGVNEAVVGPGDVLTLTMTTNARCARADVADFYLAVLVPGGSAFMFDGARWTLVFDGVQVFSEALEPFRTHAAVTTIGDPVVSSAIPSTLPPGTYTFVVALVSVGADPLDTANWVSALGQTSFSIPLHGP